MSFVVRCSQRTVPGWEAWGQLRHPPLVIFGEVVRFSCTYHRERATVWSRRESAERFARRLEETNRSTGLRAEVIEQ